MLDCDCGQLALDAANGLDSEGLNLATAETMLGLAPSQAPQATVLGGDAPQQLSPVPTLLLSEESVVQPEVGLDAATQSGPDAIAQLDNLTGLAETRSSLVGALPGFPGIGCIIRIPDLTIAPGAELQSNPDGTVTLSWAVTNLSGNNRCADVAANSFFNRFWLSSDDVLDVTGDTPIAADSAPPGTTIDDAYYRNQTAIAVDETSAVRSETFSISSDEPFLILSVNQPQGISETDFTNNVVVFDLQALVEPPIEATPVDNTGYNQDTNCAPEHDVAVNSDVETHSGALTETHTLTAYQSQGMARALTLHYDSTTADVQPIVHFAYENVQDAPGTQLLIARLSIQAGDTAIAVPGYTGDQFGLSGGEHFWTVPDQDNAVVQGALQADLSDQASGIYTYQVERDIQTFDAAGTFDPLRHTTTGTVTVVNRTGSPFGNGWSLAGWQEIVVNDDESVLLLNGDGTHQIFQPPAAGESVYESQSGDYSQLERLADGTFQRTLRDQTVTTFNAQNRLETVTDRNGNTLTYVYDAAGQLATMRDAVGLETTFTYTEGRVTAITDPAGRQTVLAYDAAGNLQSITDPDTAVRTWEYDDQSRMTAEIDQRGHRETTEYDAFGRVDRSIRRDGSVIDIDPVQVQGLALPAQTSDPITAPVALTPTAADLATPTATHTDGRGNATVFTLNQAGNLLTQTDAVGNVVTIERDCSCGEVSAIVDGTGDRTTITYDDQGNPNQIVDSLSGAAGRQQIFDPQFNQLIQATDELGRQTLHELDATGNIIEIRQVVGAVGGADDRVTTMTYLSDGLVDTVTNPLGRITNFDYDARGLVTTITTAQGTADEAMESYEYDSAGNRAAFVDARGNRTTFTYDARNRLTEIVEADPDGEGPLTTTTTQYFYDAAGNLVRRVDGREHETLYDYDTMNRLERITEADPDGAGPLASPITTMGYDADGNLTTLTDARGNVTSYTYDERNRQTQITEADPDGTGPLAAPVTRLDYDLDNNLTALTNARNVTMLFDYDARNRLERTTSADPDGDGPLPTLVTEYDYNAVDLLTQLTRPGGRTTVYQYDELNRLVQLTEPDPDGTGALTAPVTLYDYDLVGNQTQLTDALGRVTTFGYDARNRLTQITDPDPDGTGPLVAPVRGYTYDATNNQTAIIDPLGRTTTFQYDGRNRLIQITDPDPDGAGAQIAPLTRYSYDAVNNLTATSNALGHTTQYQYDALNRQIAVIDPLGAATQYGYDAVDNLLSVTDPLNNQTSYTYDGLNRLSQETNALGFSRTYGYDAMDNLTQLSDRRGQTRQFTYDNLDRRIGEQWLDATEAVQRTFDYGFDALGRLTQVQDTDAFSGTVLSRNTYNFDALDRVTSEAVTTAPAVPEVVFNYSYDAVDNRTQTTDTIAGTLSGITDYTYDALDRMTQVQQSGTGVQPKRVEMGYNVASELTSISRFVGADGTTPVASTSYSYDGTGRLEQLTHATDTATIADYQFDYDAANRLTNFVAPDGTATYTYDDRDQLTGADYTGQNNEAYTYDDNGNRTNPGYQTTANNQLTSDGVFTYEYDNEGNRIRRTRISDGQVTTYEWDHHQRLVAVSEGDGITVTQRVTYTYDAFDRRLSQSVDPNGDGPVTATTEHFVYDGDHIALVFDETGTQTHRYLHGPNVDQILAEETADGAVHWALTDHQGSVRDVIDNSGNILNRFVYDSFGQVTSETNPDFDFRFGYTGREWDEATGLMYYRARYYDPAVGRLLSEDPMGFAAGDANLYRYVFNSPTNYTDPGGMRAVPVKIGPKPSVKPRGGASSTTSGRTPTGYPVHSPELPNGPSLWPSTEELVRPLQPTLSPAEQVERWRKQAGIPEPSFGDPRLNFEDAPFANVCPVDYGTADPRYDDYDDGSGRTPLWRAVNDTPPWGDEGELSQIQRTRSFLPAPSPYPEYPLSEGKYFSPTEQGAISYATQAVNAQVRGKEWNGDPYTIVETGIATDFLADPRITLEEVDRGIPTFVIPNDMLPYLDPPVIRNDLKIPPQ